MSTAEVADLNREQRRAAQGATSGFKPERKRYRLRFEDGEFAGFVVEMRGISVGTFMEIAELGDIDPRRMQPGDIPKVRRLFEIVGSGLAAWNLLDDDEQPVPPTFEGLLTQEVPLVIKVAESWMQAVGDVPAPLDRPSSDGRPSGVESLPMEPLSVSPGN